MLVMLSGIVMLVRLSQKPKALHFGTHSFPLKMGSENGSEPPLLAELRRLAP
jgi:hypothetical protein